MRGRTAVTSGKQKGIGLTPRLSAGSSLDTPMPTLTLNGKVEQPRPDKGMITRGLTAQREEGLNYPKTSHLYLVSPGWE